MSKFFTLVFVVISLIYVLLLQQFKNPESLGWANRMLRPGLLKSGLARTVFFLNYPGDARYQYFHSNKPILVEIDYQEGRLPDEKIAEWVSDLIEETVNKEADVKIDREAAINIPGPFSDKELLRMLKVTQNHQPSMGQAYLHVIYVSGSEEFSTNTGLTLKGESVFIFRDAIGRLAESQKVQSRLEESTLKHEFGHLLGLEHAEQKNCVMNEKVEVYRNGEYQFENIPIEYCEESINRLRKISLE